MKIYGVFEQVVEITLALIRFPQAMRAGTSSGCHAPVPTHSYCYIVLCKSRGLVLVLYFSNAGTISESSLFAAASDDV